MNIDNKLLEKAGKVQMTVEQKVLSQKGVQGTSISTLPENHDKVCIKIIVDDKNVTLTSLGLQDEYDQIPVIVSHEEIHPM